MGAWVEVAVGDQFGFVWQSFWDPPGMREDPELWLQIKKGWCLWNFVTWPVGGWGVSLLMF